MSTTRWADAETGLLDAAITLLTDDVADEDKVTNIAWQNWHFTKVFDNNQSMKFTKYRCCTGLIRSKR